MTELELTRTRGDRRLYALEGIGTVRLEGMFARSATAEASGRSWHFSRRGLDKIPCKTQSNVGYFGVL